MSNEEIVVKVKESISPNPSFTPNSVDPILKGFFRLNEAEITNQDKSKLDEINDYFADLPDMEKIAALKDIRFKMGAPRLGMSELQHFHRYIRIKNSIKSQEAELKALEN